MAAPKKHRPRKWEIDDLLDLGKREKEEGQFLKAVPVIILEQWVREGREKEVANYIRTKSVARRLVDSGLHPPFKPKGSSNVVAALSRIQLARNLTRPPLIEFLGGGEFRITLPPYEKLLQDYRQEYRERYPDDYKKLFPIAKDEPDWGQPIPPKEPVKQEEDEPTPPVPQEQGDIDIDILLTQLQDALYSRQQAIETLERANEKLQAEMDTLQAREWVIVDDQLRNYLAKTLEHELYVDAVRRASVVLETRLRKAVEGTQGKSQAYGANLVAYALNKDSGKLVISEDENEQGGIHQLFSGVFAFVRNPPAHKIVEYTAQEAWHAISLIDYLLSLLGQARLREE